MAKKMTYDQAELLVKQLEKTIRNRSRLEDHNTQNAYLVGYLSSMLKHAAHENPKVAEYITYMIED
jgi:hypothetical protein